MPTLVVLARARSGAAKIALECARACDAGVDGRVAKTLHKYEEDAKWLAGSRGEATIKCDEIASTRALATGVMATENTRDVVAIPVRSEAFGKVWRALEGRGVAAECAAAAEAWDEEPRTGSKVNAKDWERRRCREVAIESLGDPGDRDNVPALSECEKTWRRHGGGGQQVSTKTHRECEAWVREGASIFYDLQVNGPVIMDGLLDACSGRWTFERVRELCDGDAVVDVHVCPHDTVDLAGHRAPGTPRNFEFRKMSFGEFFDRVRGVGSYDPVIERGERYYLRSVDGKSATDLRRTHPALAAELRIEKYTQHLKDGNFHSSVLRISSADTTLWTHYDTHDNLLVQVIGSKTVTLFPPEADQFMYVEGSSSRVFNVRNEPSEEDRRTFTLFYAHAQSMGTTVSLQQGDALWIPAYWFHHVVSDCGEAPSVAVNTFWRSTALATFGEYDAKDIYGNKELNSGKEACDLALRAGEALRHLPFRIKCFYARRAIKLLANQTSSRITSEW